MATRKRQSAQSGSSECETASSTASITVASSDESTSSIGRKLVLPTASGLDRAFACIGSTVFPRVKDTQTKQAERGTVLHRFVQIARERTREEALAEITDDDLRNQAAAIDLDALPLGAESEVALAYNPQTGEARRLDIGQREYPEDDNWLYGTADLIGVAGSTVYVDDMKTGRAVVAARDGWQLRFLAVAAARYMGVDSARVGFFYLNNDGSWRHDTAEFDGFDLDTFADDLKNLHQRIHAAYADYLRGVMPDLATGSHCTYCKSAPVCPAQTQIVRSFIPSLGELVTKLEAMTPQQRGEAYENYKVAENLMKKADEAFRLLASQEPIPLSDGKVLKEVYSTRYKAADGAAKYIANAYNVETLAACSDVKLTGMDPGIKANLEQAGLIETVSFKQLRAVRPKEK